MKHLILIALMFASFAAEAQRDDYIRPGHRPDRQEDRRGNIPDRRGDFENGRDDDFRLAYDGDLRIGARIYTRYGQAGTIRGIFANGDLSVDVNGFNQVLKRDQLAVEGCRRVMSRRLCTGDTGYTAYGQTAKVAAFFMTNELVADVNGFKQTLKLEDLAVPGCSQRLCTGDQIVTRYGQKGTILGVFTNGQLIVDINGFKQKMNASDLGSAEPGRPGRYGELRVGDRVWTRYGQNGTVAAIFASGEISVNINGFTQLMKRDQLATEGCTSTGLCSGDQVLTRYGQRGVIKAVFENRTEVVVDISGFTQVLAADQLARTF